MGNGGGEEETDEFLRVKISSSGWQGCGRKGVD